MSSFKDLESPPLSSSYSPLLSPEESAPLQWKKAYFVSFALMLLMLSALAAFIFISGTDVTGLDPMHRDPIVMDRGLKAGLSMKNSGLGMLKEDSNYNWTNQMLSWQRSGFHFQPEKNWMNDPNGPMYYKGWYHFFYQYNKEGAVWGNISWGHAVSEDLLNWKHLPLAMEPDRSYDRDGVWSGSATILPDGHIKMLYTGLLNGAEQVQNVAVPANLSDPLLLNWTKDDKFNPVIRPPSGIGPTDFRDPSTAWYEHSDSTWRVAIGAKDASNNGIALVYSTDVNFTTFTLLPNPLHAVEKVGMWECIDFFPIATDEAGANKGLNTSEVPSTITKHVLKASTSDNGQADYYAIGTYDPAKNTWVPDVESLDVGLGLRYDWGRFYASKTFYDEVKQRRILWGWVKEADSETTDKTKGWASLQGIPRSVLYDLNTTTHLLTWPVEEVKSLRAEHKDLRDFNITTVDAGSKIELKVGGAAQLDVEVEFTIEEKALELAKGEDVEYECKTSGGAAHRGLLGPFGLLVLANEDLTEQTATYFYVSKKSDGSFITHFCQDELRSSKATDTIKEIVGHTVPVLNGESFTLRVLIDHSIVESFAQGGRASVTSRVYPTEAIYSDARLFIFNYATGASITASSLNVWQMNSASNSNLMDL